jgi:GNAT superfamily N-acetyltransferase
VQSELPVISGKSEPTMFRIREAAPFEIAEIMRQRRSMYEDMGCKNPSALDLMQRTSEDFVRSNITSGAYRQWFAEIAEFQVIGGVAVFIYPWVSSPNYPRPERAYVLNMYVDPKYRRQGVARALMKEAINWCRRQGFRRIQLHASEEGKPLYETLGFRPTNEMRLEF